MGRTKPGNVLALGADPAGHLLVGGDQGASVPEVTMRGGFVEVLAP